MRPARMARQGGRRRLELAVAAVLAALLAGMLLECLIAYRAEAERVAAKQLISSLRTTLAMRSAQAQAGGGDTALMALVHQNPMRWLVSRPVNYLGEYYSAPKEGLPSGHWYFDRSAKTLVYLCSARKSFSTETQKVLVFKVKLLRVPDPVDSSGRKGVTNGLVLDQIDDQSLATNNIAGTTPHPTTRRKIHE